MPRFYFAVHGRPIEDKNGEELRSLEDAKERAHQIVLTLADRWAGSDPRDMEVVVRDQIGEVFRLKVSADKATRPLRQV